MKYNQTSIILLGAAVWLLVIAFLVKKMLKKLNIENKAVARYSYIAKTHMMTAAEERCFRILDETFSQKFYIFPQVHLSKLLDHKVKGQKYYGAFLHINSKSVDFVLCRKTNLEPVCAVELDDYTHNYKNRKERDIEVERMFEQAKFPLVRITNPQKMSKQEMIELFRKKIAETGK